MITSELKDAINRRHLDPLNKALHRANNSRYAPDIWDRIDEAKSVRFHLTKLDRFAHEILALQQSTVSELQSYTNPAQTCIVDVMKATYILLGVPDKYLQVHVYC